MSTGVALGSQMECKAYSDRSKKVDMHTGEWIGMFFPDCFSFIKIEAAQSA